MSQNMSSGNTPHNLKSALQIAAKPLFFILSLILVCSFLAHYLTASETLEEYARNNPELTYKNTGTSESTGLSKNGADSETLANDSNNTEIIPDNETFSGTKTGTTDNTSAYNIQENTTPAIQDSVPPANKNHTPEGNTRPDATEDNDMEANPGRTTYQPGFYYEPLNEDMKKKITGISYPETGCTVPYEDLNYVGLLYIDFNGDKQTGELICHKEIAQDMVEIFYELYQNQYQIERIRLIDEYSGDDTASMSDNNTSCFNYRVVDGTTSLSKHALGCAIDINPFYNPYVVFTKDGSGETYISPKGSEIYADRSVDFPYKIDENDLCYKLFTEHGFTWGGHWNSCKDYQHFQIVF